MDRIKLGGTIAGYWVHGRVLAFSAVFYLGLSFAAGL